MACYVHNCLLIKSYTFHVSSQTIAYTIYIGYIHIHHFQTFTLEQKGCGELFRRHNNTMDKLECTFYWTSMWCVE